MKIPTGEVITVSDGLAYATADPFYAATQALAAATAAGATRRMSFDGVVPSSSGPLPVLPNTGGLLAQAAGITSPLSPPRAAPASAPGVSIGLQALGLDAEASDTLASLSGCGGYGPAGGDDPWAMAVSGAGGGGGGGGGPGMLLSMPQQQVQLGQAPAALMGGGPMFMPTAPRAPRARRHSMFVSAGQPPPSGRRNSATAVAGFDPSAQLFAQQQAAVAAAAASLAAGGGMPPGYAPMHATGRVTPSGYLSQQSALASAAIAERVAATGMAGLLPQQMMSAAALSPTTLGLQQLPPQPGLPSAQLQQSLQQQQQQQLQLQQQLLAGAALPPGVFVASGPRAPASGASRRHSWCPNTVYYSTEGPRAAMQARMAYRAVGPADALAALQLAGVADGSITSSSFGALATGSAASLATPPSSVLLGSQPASPLSSGSGALRDARLAAAGLSLLPGLPGDMAQFVLMPNGQIGPLSPELLLAAGAAPDGLDAAALLDAALLASGQAYAADPSMLARLGGGKPARGAPAGGGAPRNGGVTPAAAVQLLPVPAPVSRVCGDAKWELRRCAGDAADPVTSLENLTAWLESRRTLAGERLRQERRRQRDELRAAAAAAAAKGDAAADADATADAASFPYALPDAGDDTWGGGAAAGRPASSGGDPNGGGSCEPSNKLFVGNIGWWVTEEDLYSWFSRFGNVTGVKIMYNSRKMHKPKEKWRSREYGFVDYATPAEAARAIVWMDGVELPELMKDGAGIIVQYAKPAGAGE
ncbi:hypothetical protein Rsub_06326 [Raphidocelis subcapitata]|uniref:RRM domain-containing protein n=1 Tax=Raphidocelis subcapitata TaxID=307507 RepID=A0A2V0P158_9CHLO|nr:hypothetical protein Rsub_06326 [Raphidocelis subcapitata]|eukprot:GBF93606.1 hypothetical protein Rsub_06326 [Raphidocelis subcapitata]